jgi:predicted small integral membrane protein
VTTSTPEQKGVVTFSAAQGQRISLSLSNSTYPACASGFNGIAIALLNPDGTTLESGSCLQTGAYFDTAVLPVTGTYSIRINPASYTGSATLTLYNVPPDITGNMTLGAPGTGSTATVTTSTPGQKAVLTFAGTQGQQVSLSLTGSTYPGCTAWFNGIAIAILNPDGTTLDSGNCLTAGASFNTAILPATGTYTIKINPLSYTGSATLTLSNVSGP